MRLAADFQSEWESHVADDGMTCSCCGTQLVEHFEFKVFSVTVMGRVIEGHREITLQQAERFIPCDELQSLR